jgi:hypothetical protein
MALQKDTHDGAAASIRCAVDRGEPAVLRVQARSTPDEKTNRRLTPYFAYEGLPLRCYEGRRYQLISDRLS